MKVGMFKVGEMVFYPSYGVVVIDKIEKQKVNGSIKSFYVLRILDNDVTIMVPTDSACKIGMRQLIDKKKVCQVYRVLTDFKRANLDTSETWNRRYRNYRQRIRSGLITDVAGVLRDLYLLSKKKALSTGEKRILDSAKNLVVKEISFACGKNQDLIWDKIEALLKNGKNKSKN